MIFVKCHDFAKCHVFLPKMFLHFFQEYFVFNQHKLQFIVILTQKCLPLSLLPKSEAFWF